MIFQRIRTAFSVCGMTALFGAGCGQLLGLDDYTENGANTGGAAGSSSSGGAGGQGGQGGQGGTVGECMPNETTSCYDGPAGTDGKGVCKSGLKTCGADKLYGPCEGAVLPELENCAALEDEDCNGTNADCTGNPAWSKSYGSTANQQHGNVIRGMTDGSIVVVGDFTDIVDFGCGPLNTAVGLSEIFLAKLDAQGTCQFAKRFGSAQGNDYVYSLAIAANDDIMLTGGYSGSVIDFGGGTLTGKGSNDIYIARFDKSGVHQWSKRYGDNGDQLAYSIGLDAQGNSYIAGDFGGSIDFGPGFAVSAPSTGPYAGFVAKLDPNGMPLFSHSFGIAANAGDYLSTTRMAVDAQGNTTIVGRFKGPLDVGGNMLVSAGSVADVFVIRYASDGTLLYAKQFGAIEEEYNIDVATSPDGSVYISGKTLGTALNLGAFVTNKVILSPGGGDVFLIKLNADGSFADGKVYGDSMDQEVRSVVVDPLGHVILGGNYKGQIDFGNGSLPNALNQSLFVAKFDSTLKPLWSKSFFSSQAEGNIRVGVDHSANILLTGSFTGGLQIEPGKALPNAGNSDIFVAKLAP